MRRHFLSALVLIGASTVFITEALSRFALLRSLWVGVFWLFVAAGALRGIRLDRKRFDPFVLAFAAAIACLLAITAAIAGISPPNSTDAMAYHLPRVIYWAEQSSVRFYPTQYLNQISLQPMAEYFMLHLYLLTGGDRLTNFVQWFSSFACIVGVSSIAAQFGFTPRGQVLAAVFCATIPSGILASTGAKNDYVLAIWLVCMVFFAFRYRQSGAVNDAWLLGLALGLALFTKATAYLFAPCVLVVILLPVVLTRVRGLLLVGLAALTINAPQYLRNMSLSGSPMGFDSAQGDGLFRWRNEVLGPKPAFSNISRNLSEQLGARSERWNRAVYNTVISIHRELGMDPNDPATTWRWTSFAPPKNSNHEADAPNRWHLGLLAALFLISIPSFRRHEWRNRTLYALSLMAGFVLFCAYLKWQPFLARLFLPLFVLACPLAAAIEELPGPVWLTHGITVGVLFFAAKSALFENWVRPLKGPRSITRVARDDQYFADMTQWNNRDSYKKIVRVASEQLTQSGCQTLGIDSVNFHIEYPLQALLRERHPALRFVHTGVGNRSARFAQPVPTAPCAVVCLNCADDTNRRQLYRDFPQSSQAGQFMLFFRPMVP